MLAVRWFVLLVTAAALLAAIAVYMLAPLHIDIRYEVGVKAVSVHSASETFSHRPLAFRLLMAGVAWVADALSFGITSFEVMVRLIGLGLAVGAAVLLGFGLRQHHVVAPGLHASVAAAAVVFMGARFSAEPDWMAAVLAIAGTGAALLDTGRLRWPLLAGILFVAAAGMKVVTLPVALIGLLVVGFLDRRQLVRSLIASLVVGVLFVSATLIWVPWEVTWLSDMRSVQPPVWESLPEASTFLVESAPYWPAIALVPAALILADRTERAVLAIALLLAAAPIVVQGQYYGYHAAALCVVAAIAVFRMLCGRVTMNAGIGVLAIVVAASVFSAANTIAGWRQDNRTILEIATIAVGVLGIGWALGLRRRKSIMRPHGLLLAALTTLALTYPAMTPFSAGLIRLADSDAPPTATSISATTTQEETARRIRRHIGGESVFVTYLTFGDWTYFIRNPTVCRYPSPVFLQRTTTIKYSARPIGTPSYVENLACIDEPTAQWLVWDRRWFKVSKAPDELRARFAAKWDCSAGSNIGGLTVCPRRA